MGDENLYEMRLYRRGTDSNGCEKGVLIFFPPTGEPYYFTTRERGHGYPSIPIGKYIVEHSMKNNEPNVQCFRPLNAEQFGIKGILIHRTSNPLGLEGCIAPGFPGGEADWQTSALAMKTLFGIMGGYEPGKKATLRVMTNVSYL